MGKRDVILYGLLCGFWTLLAVAHALQDHWVWMGIAGSFAIYAFVRAVMSWRERRAKLAAAVLTLLARPKR